MLMLAIRNKAFLKAIKGMSSPDLEIDIAAFEAAHQALIGNLSMIRSGQAGVADVCEMSASIQKASTDFIERRELIIECLDLTRRKQLINAEWKAQVYTSEIAKDMDQAALIIWDSLDEALDSEWLDSVIPTNFSD